MKNKFFTFFILLWTVIAFLHADERQDKKEKDAKEPVAAAAPSDKKTAPPVLHYDVTVTATRKEKSTLEVAMPVSVDSQLDIERRAPNNVAELLNVHPGMDVTGVTPNQIRPVIRGLRGQRILLLADGIRLNNSRRSQDFGEITGMIDLSQVERVEVVRGPASVLYGSDAIGGVVNIISSDAFSAAGQENLAGTIGARFDTAGNLNHENFSLSGRSGKFQLRLSGSYRHAGNFSAPAGSFGQIRLADETPVKDSGLEDHSLSLQLSFRPTVNQRLDFKHEYYNANDAGFGFVEPELYDPGAPRIRIFYPYQVFHKSTLRYENRGLNFFAADGISLQLFLLQNDRRLDRDMFIPFSSPRLPPGAGLSLKGENITDIATFGYRLEATKVLFGRHVLLYGSDFYSDDTRNADLSTMQFLNMGGPMPPTIDRTPELPNARYRSLGLFIQDDVRLTKRLSTVFGLRYQDVACQTLFTPGLESVPLEKSSDRTLTGAANFVYALNDRLSASFSIGRGFRSPNLIERFFNGVTPEGGAFQSRNTELKAETSLNLDFGLKYHLDSFFVEANYFHNIIADGIRVMPTGSQVYGLPEYRNENLEKLRLQGVELSLDYLFPFGLSLGGNLTALRAKDLVNPEIPYSNTYSSRINFYLRYEALSGAWWAEYRLRHNGNQRDVLVGNNPIGPYVPGFTVHDLAAGVTLGRKGRFPQKLGLVLVNLTNALYAEFSNAAFFQPAAKRHLVLNWSTSF